MADQPSGFTDKHLAHMGRGVPCEVVEWIVSDDSGSSSQAIVLRYFGIKTRGGWCYPLDSSDFGRCYRILKLFPWIGIDHMKGVNAIWTLMAENWDELGRLYEASMAGRAYISVTDEEVLASAPGITKWSRGGRGYTKKWDAAYTHLRDAKHKALWQPFYDLIRRCRREGNELEITKANNAVIVGGV